MQASHATSPLLVAAAFGALAVSLALTPAVASAEGNLRVPHAERVSPLGPGALALDSAFELPNPGAVADGDYERRYYKRKTYYTGQAVQSRRETVVVIEEPAPSPPPRVVIRRPPLRYDSWNRDMSLGVRTVGISYGSTDLANGKLDGEDMAGVGVALRVGLDDHWQLEFAVDYAEGSSEDANVAAMPVTASLMARLFPDSILDLYGIAGGGIHYAKIDYTLPTGDVTYMRWGGHVGGGAELRLVDHLLLTGDVRYLMLQAPPDGVPQLRTAPQSLEDRRTAEVVKEDVDDAVTNGVQFMLGIGYRW